MTVKDRIYLEMSEQEALIKDALKDEKLRLSKFSKSSTVPSYTKVQTKKRQEFSL